MLCTMFWVCNEMWRTATFCMTFFNIIMSFVHKCASIKASTHRIRVSCIACACTCIRGSPYIGTCMCTQRTRIWCAQVCNALWHRIVLVQIYNTLNMLFINNRLHIEKNCHAKSSHRLKIASEDILRSPFYRMNHINCAITLDIQYNINTWTYFKCY